MGKNKKLKEKVIGKDINKKKVELDVCKMKFRISVNGVLIEDNRILLSKQGDYYFFPGGGMEIDETIEEALIREFKEETGLEIKMKEILECRHGFWLHHYTKQCNMILLYFFVERISGELSTEGFDEYEKKYANLAEWIDVKDVGRIEFYNPVDSVKIIKKAVKIINEK